MRPRSRHTRSSVAVESLDVSCVTEVRLDSHCHVDYGGVMRHVAEARFTLRDVTR